MYSVVKSECEITRGYGTSLFEVSFEEVKCIDLSKSYVLMSRLTTSVTNLQSSKLTYDTGCMYNQDMTSIHILNMIRYGPKYMDNVKQHESSGLRKVPLKYIFTNCETHILNTSSLKMSFNMMDPKAELHLWTTTAQGTSSICKYINSHENVGVMSVHEETLIGLYELPQKYIIIGFTYDEVWPYTLVKDVGVIGFDINHHDDESTLVLWGVRNHHDHLQRFRGNFPYISSIETPRDYDTPVYVVDCSEISHIKSILPLVRSPHPQLKYFVILCEKTNV